MAINYDDKFVKRPHHELGFTVEQIEELKKCMSDPIYFFKNYTYIIHTDKGKTLFEPRDYQLEMVDLFSKNRLCVIKASRQSGKCCRYDTQIKVRNKKTGLEEEISIGDFFERTKKKL